MADRLGRRAQIVGMMVPVHARCRHQLQKKSVRHRTRLPDVARRCLRWVAHQGRFDPTRLVFIDETWAKTHMTRLRGWAARGCKLIAKVSQDPWRTLTSLATLRCHRIEAPCGSDG